MVNIMMGPEGSGKTKQLIGALNQAVQRESGSIVCIEKGDTLRFDVDHKVRLIDIKDYAYGGYPFLRGFISGLHAGTLTLRIFSWTICISWRKAAIRRRPRISWIGAASFPRKTAWPSP